MNNDDQISKRALLAAARARARQAMESDAKKVEALQRRRATITLAPVVVAVAKDTVVSSHEKLVAARERAQLAMEADRARVVAVAKQKGRAAPDLRDEESTCISSESWYSTETHNTSMVIVTPMPKTRGFLPSALLLLMLVFFFGTGFLLYSQVQKDGRWNVILESWESFSITHSDDASSTERNWEGFSEMGVFFRSILSWCGCAIAKLGWTFISDYPRLTAVTGLSILPAMAMTLRRS
jgi:hypothetical protein